MKTASFTYTGPGRIAITRGRAPRSTPSGYRYYRALAPTWGMLKLSYEKYRIVYFAEILGRLDPATVMGPLALDLVLSVEAARLKGMDEHPVAGNPGLRLDHVAALQSVQHGSIVRVKDDHRLPRGDHDTGGLLVAVDDHRRGDALDPRAGGQADRLLEHVRFLPVEVVTRDGQQR